jgi:serine/threonine protein kinase
MQLKMLISELHPVEAVEIDPLGTRPRTLRDRLRECREKGERGISGEELVHSLEGPAKALDFLHEPMHDLGSGPGPVVHGGVNPRNLVIVDSTVKVADWANQAKWKTFEVHRRVTPSAVVRGVAFSSPEAIAGKPEIGSDQYSLAVVYAALRTSALPYHKGANPAEMMDLVRRGELDFSRLPKSERRVILKATALDPEKRWPTCSYLIRALGVALSP